jgi:DNA polymerase-3 subunit epsilon
MTQDKNTPSLEDLLQSSTAEHLELVAQLLGRYPDKFRVIRHFDADELMLKPDQIPEDAAFAIILDTEGTGINTQKDHVIELGMVEIAYDPLIGFIYGVTRVFDELEDPGIPIPEEATRVNGITDDMVAGKRIDDNEVQDFVARADLVLCHNSGYDRPMLEKRWPFFQGKPFACSLKQVDWQAAGISSAKLEFLAYHLGFFYDAHRAESDCMALIKVLNTPLSTMEEMTPFQMILQAFRKENRRVWATGAPFDAKDQLRENGYRWFDPAKDGPTVEKAWAKELPEDELDAELEWLKATVFKGKSLSLPLDKVDAFCRFTNRRVPMDRIYR